MLNKIIAWAIALLMPCLSISQDKARPFVPYVKLEVAKKRADSICKLMSLDEKLDLIKGYKSFYIKPFAKYGIPQIRMADATQGIRIMNGMGAADEKRMDKTTSFPAPIGLAATWNRELSYQYAQAVGEECRQNGIHILLGPGLNIYRNSQCGRNFEYLGEDPFLVSRMVENYVAGMQNTGTMAAIKHFLANNTELDRKFSNTILKEREIFEIYTPAFKAGIDAGALSVMTSYNLINGEWAGQSAYVINQLLRKDLGFNGLVMSDWNSVWDAEKIIKSGQDLEMPVGASLEKARSLLSANKVNVEEIDRMVNNILKSCITIGFLDRPQLDKSFEKKFSEHKQVALQTAREATVLLKNTNGILPVRSGDSKILLTGTFSDSNAYGKGAALVTGYDVVTMKSALESEFKDRLIFNKQPSDDDIRNAPLVILSTGTIDGENFDRPFNLPSEEEAFVKRVCSLNPRTIVVVNSGSGVDMSNWDSKAAAILYAWYPGQIGQVALAEIISGKVNPSGKLPMTIERKFEDSPAYGYAPANKPVKWPGSDATPREKNGTRELVYDIKYNEGIFVGYRWYEHKKIKPLYPFGHGLSYTKFVYKKLKVDSKDFSRNGQTNISYQLKNTGKLEGMEIAQVYIRDKKSSVERPVKELKSFDKISLKPGESRYVKLTLSEQDFKFWDTRERKWKLEPGEFEILIGSSSENIALAGSLSL